MHNINPEASGITVEFSIDCYDNQGTRVLGTEVRKLIGCHNNQASEVWGTKEEKLIDKPPHPKEMICRWLFGERGVQLEEHENEGGDDDAGG